MNRPSWDKTFMDIAVVMSKRSRDENTQVGAVIVDTNHKIVSTGYNGLPRTCDHVEWPTKRDGAWLDTKYPYYVHAELNAILNAPKTNLSNCVIYSTLIPCCECTKAILQCGISRIVYLEDKHPEEETFQASRAMIKASGIKLEQYKENENDRCK